MANRRVASRDDPAPASRARFPCLPTPRDRAPPTVAADPGAYRDHGGAAPCCHALSVQPDQAGPLAVLWLLAAMTAERGARHGCRAQSFSDPDDIPLTLHRQARLRCAASGGDPMEACRGGGPSPPPPAMPTPTPQCRTQASRGTLGRPAHFPPPCPSPYRIVTWGSTPIHATQFPSLLSEALPVRGWSETPSAVCPRDLPATHRAPCRQGGPRPAYAVELQSIAHSTTQIRFRRNLRTAGSQDVTSSPPAWRASTSVERMREMRSTATRCPS